MEPIRRRLHRGYRSYSPMQGTFFFKRYFYVFFDIFLSTCRTTLIFSPTHSLMFGECFGYLESVLKIISHNSGVFWSENLLKKWKKSDLSRSSKIGLEDFFKRYFYVSFDIFISTSRTTLIFFIDTFLDVRRVFQVPSKCVENDFSQFWSRLKWKSPQKMEKTQNFRDAPKSVLKTFLSDNFTFPLIFSFLRVVRL